MEQLELSLFAGLGKTTFENCFAISAKAKYMCTS